MKGILYTINRTILLIVSFLCFACQSDSAAGYRLPAEFEPQTATWLLWPPIDHKNGYANDSVTLQLIEALIEHQGVTVLAADDSLYQAAKAKIPAEIQANPNFSLRQMPYFEFWARDMGPTFLVDEAGELAIADFGFNAWGYGDTSAPEIKLDERLDRAIAHSMSIPTVKTPLISEGGDHESNGQGTLMLVETVEKGRNPEMSLAEIEAEFKRVVGVSNIIWLKEGLYEDDHTFRGPLPGPEGVPAYTVVTTNGHIDEFARFVNPTTILLAEVDPSERETPLGKENHRRLEENYEILRQAKDQDGKPFKIIRIPLPPPLYATMQPGDVVFDFISTLDYQDGSVFPKDQATVIAAASYLNFIIANGLIIGQKYWKPGMLEEVKERDEKVETILAEAFPNRKILMLDAFAVNLGGGGVHCISMHQPATY